MNSNISAPCRATGKFWYSAERSVPALQETPPTFILTTIIRGAMAFQSKMKFFCGHPVDICHFLMLNVILGGALGRNRNHPWSALVMGSFSEFVISTGEARESV